MVLVDIADHTIAKRRANARGLAGGLDSNDFADNRVDEKLNNGDTTLEIMTDKSWVSTDSKWNAAILASDYWAAAEMLDEIPNHSEEANAKRDAAEKLFAKINSKAENQGDGEDPIIVKTAGAEE